MAVTGPELAILLQNNRAEIVTDWVSSLQAGEYGAYEDVPADELESACRQCLAAFIATLRTGDHGKMRRFGRREVRRRVAQGYHQSEIDQLLGACRLATTPVIIRQFSDSAVDAVGALNILQRCIDHALFEMADFYQLLAQQQAEEHLAEMEAMNRQLEEISVRDPLTSLYNRRYLEGRLQQEFERGKRHQRSVALVMLDIDHFKRVNDTYGHPVGDIILRAVAALLIEGTRAIDVPGRFGGEEFLVVLPETPLSAAHQVAERLRERASLTTFHTAEKDGGKGGETEAVRCTISLGVAAYEGNHYDSAADFLRATDDALYAAKHGGRNQVALATDPARVAARLLTS